jgi:hypothetical protein
MIDINDPQVQKEIADAMKAAREKSRGYADFFGWAINRDLEEWGVLDSLFESMEKDGSLTYTNLQMRGRGNDPPDCEGLNFEQERIAIEVTELVDGNSIKNHKAGNVYEMAEWDRDKFLKRLHDLLKQKDAKFPKLKDPPYKGGYTVVVFTDEDMLRPNDVSAYLEGHIFKELQYITEALLLISYEPKIGCCPYFRLNVEK